MHSMVLGAFGWSVKLGTCGMVDQHMPALPQLFQKDRKLIPENISWNIFVAKYSSREVLFMNVTSRVLGNVHQVGAPHFQNVEIVGFPKC